MGSHGATQHHGDGPSAAASAAPELVQIMLTTRCSLSCPHCLAVDDGAPPESMALGLAQDVVDQVLELGVSELLLTGGEPTEHEGFAAVVERIAAGGGAYSLNVARLPRGEAAEAIEAAPPRFVAVSLDGPREVHDEFRGLEGAFDEALSALELYSGLGASVVAGTTVTSKSFPHLAETLTIVASSAAERWGLHLLLPEGRARRRPDLFLRRPQVRRLLRFVKEKRRYLDVEVADELGFLGEVEPFVRSVPLRCGAARTSCVVLPSGHVVPCTTVDLSTSAGSLRTDSLERIWRHGFAELRREEAGGKCRGCQYTSACGGGCWLQRRRAHVGCLRPAWETPAIRAAAASFAAATALLGGCVGELGSCTGPSSSSEGAPGGEDAAAEVLPGDGAPLPEAAPAHGPEEEPPIVCAGEAADGGLDAGADADRAATPTVPTGSPIESAILAWSGSTLGGGGVAPPRPPAGEDPGWRFFQAYRAGTAPAGLLERSAAVTEALDTEERSLALAALLYRALAESILDSDGPAARTEEERRAVAGALAALAQKTRRWEREVFLCQLEPYLRRGRAFPQRYRSMLLKSLERRRVPRAPSGWELLERDTLVERWGARGEGGEPLEGWLDRHHHGEGLAIAIARVDGEGGSRVRLGAHTTQIGRDAVELRSHDVVVTPPGSEPVALSVSWQGGEPFLVQAPSGAELTLPDLLRLATEQHGEALVARAAAAAPPGPGRRPVAEPLDPLLLPSMRQRSDRAARLWLMDFWMY